VCGICGIVSLSGKEYQDSNRIVEKMNSSMTHRGPDEEGYYTDRMICLGSRRLSIIDLESGQQPISNENSSLQIILNGEIYNFRELRQYLEKHGHQFKTNTDTEVILHLYEEFGTDCVQHLDGIFAFAIWNNQQAELFIARDRMGIKPLYYTVLKDGTFVFGSEMKVILSHPGVERDIDLISLNEYLSYEYVPTPRTIIRNIYRLEAGYFIMYNQYGLKKFPYDRLSFQQAESRPPVDWRDYANGLHHTIRSAVQRELVSDVPVGVLLSGGVDSSTIAAMMVDMYPGKVESFTIGFENTSFNETPYSRQVANYLGTQHNEMILTSKQSIGLIEELPDIMDEPFADSSFIPTYLLSKFANEKVKVVLGGDGGDELFAGYPTLVAHQLIGLYERLIPWSIRAKAAPFVINRLAVSFENISFDFRLRKFLSGRNVPLISRHQRWLGSFLDEEKQYLFQDWIKPVLRETYYQSFLNIRECDAKNSLNQILYNDLKLYLEGDILYKVDRASMANSLEVRVPLLNREVVDYAMQLPVNLKLNKFTSKYILKKAVRNILPPNIINRPKKGFNMPVAYWLNTDLKPMLLDMLSVSYIKEQGLFNHNYIDNLLNEHQSKQKDNRKLLWTLLMFQMWFRNYIQG
jgi:asparagine synthase (glutamine-hydrolysing)